MDWLPADSKAILLVGEANFSFSLTLAVHLVKRNIKLTASSFETESDVKGRLQGGENVALLQQYGADVLYQVDATKLHITESIQCNQYDVIIFNFPHIGKKAGINKNRQLLKEFFESCSSLLTPTGRVIVSLCNGQGGTPMDTPQREWNNSWQIVAMATYGGFILRAAIPFVSAFPLDYCNTGYRGQNKMFLNEGAVTHIFQKGPHWIWPGDEQEPTDITSSVTTPVGSMYYQPDDLSPFKARKLLLETRHPLKQTRSNLISALKTAIPHLHELNSSSIPELIQVKHSQCPNEYVVEVNGEGSGHDGKGQSVSEVKGQEKRYKGGRSDRKSDTRHDVNVDFESSATKGTDNMISQCSGQTVYSLVSSLLQHTPGILHADEPSQPVVVTSEIYHGCPIDRNVQVLPIMHQMLVILPHQDDGLWDCFEDVVLHVLKCAIDIEMDSEGKSVALRECDIEQYNSNKSSDHEYSMIQHATCTLPESLQIADLSSVNSTRDFATNIGICGKLSSTKTAKFFLINLDHLAMCKFNIDDIRLLWSEDLRQWDNSRFSSNPISNPHIARFESLSKFPPSYIHDLSFWISEDVQFDELKFIAVVRKIAGLLLEDVRLIDSYTDDRMGRVSLCYRFIYRSIDKALSKDQARLIQSVVRESVSKEICVELR